MLFSDTLRHPADWRNDPGLSFMVEYKKKFAVWPIWCSDSTKVWLKYYYKKYEHWGHSLTGGNPITLDECYLHTDYIESITEEEYIIRKLSENL